MHFRIVLAILTLVGLMGPGLISAQEAQEPEEDVTRLDEVVVTGTRTPHTLKDVPVETVVVTREDIERSNAQTVGDILKTIPGLGTSGTDDIFGSGTNRIRMNGLDFNSGYGLVLIDGQRVQAANQSGGHGVVAIGLNQIPVSMIERIEVVKGPSSVLYGSDAMVGVINIITRKVPAKQKRPTVNVGATYGWYKVKERVRDGETTKPSDDGDYRNTSEAYAMIGARPYDRFGYQLNYAYEKGESTGQDPYDDIRHSVMAKTDFTLTDHTDLWIKGELNDFERDAESPRDENTYRIAAGLTWAPSTKHSVQVRGYHYMDEFDAVSSSLQWDGEIEYNQIEAQYSWSIGNNQTLTTGAEFQRQSIDHLMKSYPDGVYHSEAPIHEDLDTVSCYIQDELTLFKNLTLVPGIRYDDHSTFGDSWNPKLSLMYRLWENTTFRGSVGKGFKSPTITQLYYSVPWYHVSYWIKANPDLEPEKSIGYTASIEQSLMKDKVILSLSLFRNDLKNKVIIETSDELYNGEEMRVYRNVEEAMTQGADFSAKMMFDSNLSISAGYSYADTENKDTGKELTYVPHHQVTLSPAYEYEPWGLGGSATYGWFSKQYTDADNTYIQDEHSVLDAQIYKQFGKSIKLCFQVDNIFDSDKGDERNFRTGRTLLLKIDAEF